MPATYSVAKKINNEKSYKQFKKTSIFINLAFAIAYKSKFKGDMENIFS